MKRLFFYMSAWSALLVFPKAVVGEHEFVIKYSHLAVPDPTIQASSAHAVVFKAQLEKLSNGRIRVDIFPSGQLAGQVSSVQQVRKGTIHIADISSGVLASLYYPPLEVLDIPYVFPSRAAARMVLDNHNPFTKKLIEQCTRKYGIRILALAPFGFRHMTNNVRPIRTPEDMTGLKIRTMEIVPHMKLMESLGATPVPVPWLELYTSLQTKVVDGEETTLQNIVMGKLYQVQEHLTLTGHLMGVGAFLCNEKWYQSLPEDLKSALIETEKTARQTYDRVGEQLDEQALEKLKAYGMQVHSLTPDQTQMFVNQARPYVRKWMEQNHGKEFVSEFFSAIEAAENQLKQQTDPAKLSLR
ncbi:MAG: TRAP transporter substrate-binding protein [Planctomycetota bacterium]|jgi:C4-dicarboxylate-binding protein DctP